MTDSDWKTIGHGFSGYQVHPHDEDGAQIRSVDRVTGGRRLRGVVLTPRRGNRGYLLVDVRDDEGRKLTRTLHSLKLLAFAGPPPGGQVSRHLNDDQMDNRWPENLAYGTPSENELDKFRNGRPRPVPPKQPPRPCIRCSQPVDKGGRRCHACVVEIGEKAAELLASGVVLEEVGKRLEYPHLSGLLVLAQKYGRLRLTLAAPPVPEPPPSHGVMATLRHILRRGGR